MRPDPILTPAGDHGLLVDFEEIDAGHLHAAARRAAELRNLTACIVGHSSLLLLFRSRPPDAEVLWAIGEAVTNPVEAVPRVHTIDVSLATPDAPDLKRLLEHLDATRKGFVAALSATTLHARFLGFRAGFAYLEGTPRSWHLPRLATPRTRVPAGSFAVAGPMAGFYPIDSQGGWNVIGRSSAVFWDPWRDPPGLIAASDEIRIRPTRQRVSIESVRERRRDITTPIIADVIHPGQATAVITGPRMDRYARGLPCGGAFDVAALRAANRAVGNDPDGAALEISFVGPRLRFVTETIVSWHGAPVEVAVNGSPARTVGLIQVAPGDDVVIGRVGEGVRGVLAVRGGIADPAPPFAVEPQFLRAGNCLRSGELEARAPRLRHLDRTARLHLRVVAGPHRISLEMLQQIVSHSWTVRPEMNRVAVRLRSEFAASRLPHDLRSCGMQFGTVQWHPSGELVVMGPDHPITGGYLQPVTVIEEDHWKIGQLAPGEHVRFEIVG